MGVLRRNNLGLDSISIHILIAAQKLALTDPISMEGVNIIHM